MDRKVCEESAKDASAFKCEKVLHAIHIPTGIPTPQKKTESLSKSKEAQTLLPEKYMIVADLFNHMSCSLRLLHLYKKSPTFQNICKQIEVLAKRNFSCTHLAQLKYILSEGIQIDKVNVYDKKSLCMKPDMKITLVFEVVEEHSEPSSADMAFRQYFYSRLINFINMHPEGTDIPEATLPEPFSQRACSLLCEDLSVNSSTELSSTSNQIEPLLEKSHLSPTFSRHFSQQDVASQTEEVQCSSSSKTSLSSDASDCPTNQESESTWKKAYAPLFDCRTNLYTERGKQEEPLSMCFQPNVINTPVHMISPPHSVNRSSSKSPVMKIVSDAELMIQTPAQSAPAKLLPGSDVKLQNMTAQNSASCFKPAKRVLDFTLMEGNDGLDLDNRVNMLDSSKALHEFDCISKPSRGCSKNCNSFSTVALPQEVQENLGYSLGKTNQNQAGLDALDKNISSLVDLVNVIDSIFGHVKRTPITKEELLQKIIMNSLDIVEIREVEEQIEILEKLVPDWICKKLVSTGDTMYCVKNVLDLDQVRSRLVSNVTEGSE